MTLNEKIEMIVWDMDNWDLETLLEWAQTVRYDMLHNVDEATVNEEYEMIFGND